MNRISKWKYKLIIGIILSFIVIGGFFLTLRGLSGEDSWIKNNKGQWIKHGNPAETPSYVLEQQQAINCALNKFENFTEEKNSQCLGVCGNYAVDIVHVPRIQEDNDVGNQCEDYISGKVNHFIELDKNGEVVRIV